MGRSYHKLMWAQCPLRTKGLKTVWAWKYFLGRLDETNMDSMTFGARRKRLWAWETFVGNVESTFLPCNRIVIAFYRIRWSNDVMGFDSTTDNAFVQLAFRKPLRTYHIWNDKVLSQQIRRKKYKLTRSTIFFYMFV